MKIKSRYELDAKLHINKTEFVSYENIKVKEFILKKTNIAKQKSFSAKKNRQNRIKKSWKEVLLKVLFGFLSFLFFALAFWIIIFSNMVKVKIIEITGKFYGDKITSDDIRKFISGKYIFVIPKDNILFVSKKNIRQSVKQQDETIKDVSIKKIFPDKLSIDMVQRKKMLVWNKNNNLYFLDENGYAFYRIAAKDESEDAMIVNDASGGDIQMETMIVAADEVLFFHDLPEKIKEKTGYEIERELYVPSKMSQEVQVRTKEGWIIYFSLIESLEYQSNVLKKVLSENIPGEKLGDLEYIDLRLKGRAIYRLKQEEEEKTDESGELEGGEGKNDEDDKE